MHTAIRKKLIVVLAIGMTAVLGYVSPITSVVVKLTATALYMGGTGSPLSTPPQGQSYISTYIDRSQNRYVVPSGLCTGGADPGNCNPVAVYGPEQLWPVTGLFDMRFDASRALGVQNLDNCLRGLACTRTLPPFAFGSTGQGTVSDSVYTVLGYSQSSSVASLEKAALIAQHFAGAAVSFVMLANPNRPNGGILARFAGLSILGITFNGAAPTNSDPLNPLTTVDIARQYDGVADFPANPLNPLAVLNAILGVAFLHSTYNTAPEAPQLQGQYQDTTYYMIPSDTLPLLMPVKAIPIIGPLLETALDPFLRVLVEAGYNRTMNPGTPNSPFYFHPLQTLVNLIAAIPVAIDNVLSLLSGNPAYRPLGTTKPGPFGVGGPPVRTVDVDPYGPPTPALMAAPAPMLMSALSGSADLSASEPLMTSRSMALFSVEPDPPVVEEDATLLTDPTDLTVQTESPVTTDPTQSATTEPTPSATTEPTPSVTSDPKPSATTDPTPSATTESTPSATADPTPSATTEPKPSATTESTPSATADPKPSTTVDPKPSVAVDLTHAATTDPKTSATTDPKTSGGTGTTSSTDPKTTSGTDPKTTSGTESKTTSGTDPKTTSGTESKTTSGTESKTSSGSAAAA